MAQGDLLILGPYKYRIVKREGNKLFLQWIESSGVTKELWVNLNRKVS